MNDFFFIIRLFSFIREYFVICLTSYSNIFFFSTFLCLFVCRSILCSYYLLTLLFVLFLFFFLLWLFQFNIFLIQYYSSHPLNTKHITHTHTNTQIEVIYQFHWAIEVALSLALSLVRCSLHTNVCY